MNCFLGCSERDPGQGRAGMIDVAALSSFLILMGVLELIPGSQWAYLALGAGAITLAKNLARHAIGMRVRPLGLILGGGAFVTGLAGSAFPGLPLVAVFLVATGAMGLGAVAMGFTTPGTGERHPVFPGGRS